MRFVNWQAVNAVYCGVIWMIALVVALVILVHGLPQSPPPAHHAAPAAVR
jgi:hypothetical protein